MEPGSRLAAVGDVRGLWRRTLYRRADEVLDSSTEVHWLQGPRYFADIRQPVERISFAGVGCLRDLDNAHLAWLAQQEAFAGDLQLDGTLAWWQRSIDMQPQGPFEDRARLSQDGDVLDEYGTESPYYERWERSNPSTGAHWGLHLASEADGRRGFLVRAADRMMFARARRSSLPPGRTLAKALAALPTLEERQDLLDVEVSLGSVAANEREWLIERSTLPFKTATRCSIRRREDITASGARVIELDDLDAEGRRIIGLWRILDADAPEAAAEFAAPISVIR
jgi:hypothetical protein